MGAAAVTILRALFAAALLLVSGTALAQSASAPYVVTGQEPSGKVDYSPVGTGAAGSVSMPVTATFTPSGTQNVNVTQVGGATVATGHGTAAGALRVELPTDGTGVLATVGAVTAITNALPAGTAILGKIGIDQTTPGTTNGVQINAALPAGANLVGKVGIDQTTPGTTNGVQVNAALPAGTNTIGAVASVGATATARGLAITTGGTSQTLIAANASRKAFTIQNPCSASEQGIATAEDLAINLTSASTLTTSANLAVLAPCASFSMGITAGLVSTELVTGIAATTSHVVYIKEF